MIPFLADIQVRGNYYWKLMTKDIASFISKCENCSINKHKIHTKEAMVISETPAKPFDLVHSQHPTVETHMQSR